VIEPQRVVVRGPNWLGDLVMAAPSIRAVADAWRDAAVQVAVPAAFAPLVPLLHPRVTGLALEGGGTRAVNRHAAQLRDGAFDVALLLTNSFASALAVRLAGVPERWGYRRDGRGWLLTRAVQPRRVRRTSPHHADYYAGLLEALELPRPALDVQAVLPQAVRTEAVALLREAGWDGRAALLACAPGAAYGTAKQWPPSHVARVVDGWIADGGCVALVGAPADRVAATQVLAHLAARGQAGPAGPVIDLTGRTSLLTLAGVVRVASRVLANDSGAMHLAAALGTPTVTVFGPTQEKATAPLGPHRILTHEVWCRPCMLRECPLDHRCMTGVPPERVLAALREP
jgi:heptosyltransferase-2